MVYIVLGPYGADADEMAGFVASLNIPPEEENLKPTNQQTKNLSLKGDYVKDMIMLTHAFEQGKHESSDYLKGQIALLCKVVVAV